MAAPTGYWKLTSDIFPELIECFPLDPDREITMPHFSRGLENLTVSKGCDYECLFGLSDFEGVVFRQVYRT